MRKAFRACSCEQEKSRPVVSFLNFYPGILLERKLSVFVKFYLMLIIPHPTDLISNSLCAGSSKFTYTGILKEGFIFARLGIYPPQIQKKQRIYHKFDFVLLRRKTQTRQLNFPCNSFLALLLL